MVIFILSKSFYILLYLEAFSDLYFFIPPVLSVLFLILFEILNILDSENTFIVKIGVRNMVQ